MMHGKVFAGQGLNGALLAQFDQCTNSLCAVALCCANVSVAQMIWHAVS